MRVEILKKETPLHGEIFHTGCNAS